MLFSPSFDDYILSNDPVRVVNSIVDGLDLTNIYRQYKDLGCSSYHPKMMIKVVT